MVEFGEEFIIESYRIPWLIWIQLLVMILLVILLYSGFALLDSDPSTAASSSAAPPAPIDRPSSSRPPKVENVRNRSVAGSSGEPRPTREDEIENEPSLKDSVFVKMFRSPNHPCNYFGLFKQAFLKCLGLDPSTESTRNHQHDKQE